MNTLSATSKKIMTVLLLIVACFMLATMSGCGKSAEDTIRESVTAEFESIKKLDRTALEQITGGAESVSDFEELGISSEEFFRTWLNGFDYSVNKVTVNGNTATATVTVKTHSLIAALDSITNNIDSLIASNPSILTMTDDQIYKQLGSMLMKAIKEAPMVSYTVDLPYELKNNTWQPAAGFEEAIAQAFTGSSDF